MAHKAQKIFCSRVKKRLPEFFSRKRVLDAGSLDLNGNNRWLFEEGEYIGVDIQDGWNVDVVSPIHEYEPQDGPFDTIICTEVFEHDFYWKESLQRIVELLKPGGLFLFTCATTGRPIHRKKRKEGKLYKYGLPEWGKYYRNLAEEDIRQVIEVEDVFSKYEFSTSATPQDLYFWGIKKEEGEKGNEQL